VPEVLECDLRLEQLAMPQLREAIPHCEGVRDFVTRELFSEILKGEEGHVDFLETQLELIGKIGRENYIQLQAEPVEGVSPAGVERVLDYRDHPEFDDWDKLVVEFAIAAWERPSRIPDALFTRLNEYFSEAQLVELTLRITLCGFFNKFNDALGIEEEPEAVERLVAISASSE
jgi:hypothetical protein